ncbi:hypothetical protein ACQP1O_33160 [Nocardia sp. CA-151230]|uniref:hypothetical protein n=1 Tax=Nocardia sp. CA-151230 TaxID=3239982 RepID=UPI003D93FDE0
MAVGVYVKSRDDQLKDVRYVAGHMVYFGAANQHRVRIPATISVEFGEGSLELDIDDARSLMFGLAVALVRDAATPNDAEAEQRAVA